MIDAGLALLAALCCRDDRALRRLCLSYAAARIAFLLLAPSAGAAGPAWYFICAAGELVVIAAVVVVPATAARLVAKFSIFGILVHVVTGLEYLFMSTSLLYSAYPWAINAIEAMQVAALFLFSPPALRALRAFLARFSPPRHLTRHDPRHHEDTQCRRVILKFG